MKSHGLTHSYSSSSVDLVQLLHASLCPSLITESMTLDSLPSQSSLPPGSIPFPNCRGPAFQLVELGDHLRLFSNESPTKSRTVGTTRNQNRTVLSAPTAPRLTRLIKECLSIDKWAEASRGWHAPGHIPWENVPEPADVSWTPEGSVYSRETFVNAIKSTRLSRLPRAKSDDLSSNSDDTISNTHLLKEEFRPSEQEIEEMMTELKCLRSYFQDSLQSGEDPTTAQAPKSRTTTSQRKANALQSHTLASRRGKQTPTRLFLSKKPKPKDISYPGIPTAFLGSPTRHDTSLKPMSTDLDAKMTMNAQDMILHLRSQCSAMLVQKPPLGLTKSAESASAILDEKKLMAPALNQKASPVPTESAKHTSKGSMANLGSPTVVKQTMNRIHRVPAPTIGGSEKASTTLARSRRDGIILKSGACTTQVPSTTNSPTCITSSLPAASTTCRQVQGGGKTVRFETRPMDIKKVASMATSEDESQSSVADTERPDPIVRVVGLHESALRYKGTKNIRPRTLPSGPKSQAMATRPSTSVPLASDESMSPPAIASQTEIPTRTPAPCHLPQASKTAATKDSKVHNDGTALHSQETGLATHPLGRNSLSRIIRGPMFSAPKEIKRETVCMGPKISKHQHTVDVRPSSEIVGSSGEKRKSRMPGPLRSIFTRFK